MAGTGKLGYVALDFGLGKWVLLMSNSIGAAARHDEVISSRIGFQITCNLTF